jgi:hypothetical protein
VKRLNWFEAASREDHGVDVRRRRLDAERDAPDQGHAHELPAESVNRRGLHHPVQLRAGWVECGHRTMHGLDHVFDAGLR